MSEQEFTPVYLITGFLESGKTQLINSMLTDDNFSRGQKTLVICSEEGVEEYETAKNTTVVVLDEADEMNTKKMEALDKEYQPERVIIEYNSIWTIERLGSCMLPRKWEVVQIITTVDANTFDNYFTNMRQMLTDPMKVADLILVNRCQPGANKSPWRRQLKAVNPKTNIIFENTDGTSEDGVADEDLPYDMKSAVIEIKDEDIPTFYLDSLDHADRYDRKTVRLVGQAFADRSLPKGYYMFGRMAMTCCAPISAVRGQVSLSSGSTTSPGFSVLPSPWSFHVNRPAIGLDMRLSPNSLYDAQQERAPRNHTPL